ncbi:MAG: hypothetical protein WD708_01650, partial [Kiritimatiellia bacterium]
MMPEVKPDNNVVATIAESCGLTEIKVREALHADSLTSLNKRRQILKTAQDPGYFSQVRNHGEPKGKEG